MEKFYLRYCLPRKIGLNREYAEHASVVRDIWIILQTLCPYWLGVLAVYGIALTASYWLAYQLRSDFAMSSSESDEFKRCLPWIVLPQLLLLLWQGQLRGLMSYFSIPELRRTVAILGAALALQLGLCHVIQSRQAPALSIFLTDFVLSLFALAGVRMALRVFRESCSRTNAKADAKPCRCRHHRHERNGNESGP